MFVRQPHEGEEFGDEVNIGWYFFHFSFLLLFLYFDYGQDEWLFELSDFLPVVYLVVVFVGDGLSFVIEGELGHG